jgi:hypothetical protein
MALNIGVADASRRTADLPLYTLRRRATGETVKVPVADAADYVRKLVAAS